MFAATKIYKKIEIITPNGYKIVCIMSVGGKFSVNCQFAQ